MRRGQFPPRPKPEAAARTPEPPTRKVFNCIVDDTALIAGVKKSTRDGIRKWISQGAIRLFVPLHSMRRPPSVAAPTNKTASPHCPAPPQGRQRARQRRRP